MEPPSDLPPDHVSTAPPDGKTPSQPGWSEPPPPPRLSDGLMEVTGEDEVSQVGDLDSFIVEPFASTPHAADEPVMEEVDQLIRGPLSSVHDAEIPQSEEPFFPTFNAEELPTGQTVAPEQEHSSGSMAHQRDLELRHWKTIEDRFKGRKIPLPKNEAMVLEELEALELLLLKKRWPSEERLRKRAMLLALLAYDPAAYSPPETRGELEAQNEASLRTAFFAELSLRGVKGLVTALTRSIPTT